MDTEEPTVGAGPVDADATATDEEIALITTAKPDGPGETQWDGNENLEVMDPRAEMVSQVEFLNNRGRGEISDLEPAGSPDIESAYDVTGEVTLETNAANDDGASVHGEFDAGALGFEDFFGPADASQSASDTGADAPTRDHESESYADGKTHVSEADYAQVVGDESLAISDNPEPVGFFARLWGVLRGTVATSRRMDEGSETKERNKASSQR